MNIHEGTECVVRALLRFSERHVTQYQPMACTHFKMRYNNIHSTQSTLLVTANYKFSPLWHCYETKSRRHGC